MERNSGFSIVELLVTIVLVSIGLLGLMKLQLSGVQSSHDAYMRSQGTLQTEDLIERIRANPPRNNPPGHTSMGPSDDYRNLYASLTSTSLDCDVPPTPYCADSAIGEGETCNAFEMADFDFYVSVCGSPTNSEEPPRGILGAFTDGVVTVECVDDMSDDVCAAGSLHTVSLSWKSRQADANNDPQIFSVTITF